MSRDTAIATIVRLETAMHALRAARDLEDQDESVLRDMQGALSKVGAALAYCKRAVSGEVSG